MLTHEDKKIGGEVSFGKQSHSNAMIEQLLANFIVLDHGQAKRIELELTPHTLNFHTIQTGGLNMHLPLYSADFQLYNDSCDLTYDLIKPFMNLPP
ncbi:hypothetical protein TNCV_232731 [Trichonephila clavipes]|nr:hypothetical protein TNCV_232731 [Trichonephila clavipes]